MPTGGPAGERHRTSLALGALAFFVAAPGTVAGFIPFLLTDGRPAPALLGPDWTRWAGMPLVAAGAASLVESFVRFVTVGRGTPAPVAPPDQLVVTGQYRYVRNPMYVALLAIVTGEGLLLARPILFAYAGLLALAFHLRVLFYEEPRLTAQFGAGYDDYRRHVPRWRPRLRPWGRRRH